jgi:hypothetical protein
VKETKYSSRSSYPRGPLLKFMVTEMLNIMTENFVLSVSPSKRAVMLPKNHDFSPPNSSQQMIPGHPVLFLSIHFI